MSMPRDSQGRFVSPDNYDGQLRKAHAWIQLGSEGDTRDLYEPAYSFEAIDGDRHLVGCYIQIYGPEALSTGGFGNVEVSKSAQAAFLGETPTAEPGKVDIVSADETRSSVIGYAGFRDSASGGTSPDSRQRITDTKTVFFSSDRMWNQGQEIHVHGEVAGGPASTTARVMLFYTEQ